MQIDKGYVGVETYYYPNDGADIQAHGSTALIAQLDTRSVLSERWSAKLTPFVREDRVDESRRSFDLREAELDYTSGSWMFAAGMRQMSWSVTESVNVIPFQVVDIINQRNLAGDPSGQEKLGAAMLMLSYQSDRDLVQGFYLPWFRDRKFPDVTAREHPFQGAIDLNTDPQYTNSADEYYRGIALRWEHAFDAANLALIGYRGYAPQPVIIPDVGTGKSTNLYYLVDMYGLTLQATLGEWTIKSEMAYNDTSRNPDRYASVVPDNYFSTASGVEYTLVRLIGQSDVGLFAEWLYDSRGPDGGGSVFQNDVFVGARWVANDTQDTNCLGGVVRDLDERAAVYHFQCQRRIGSHLQLQAIVRAFSAEQHNPLNAVEDDTLIFLKLRYYF